LLSAGLELSRCVPAAPHVIRMHGKKHCVVAAKHRGRSLYYAWDCAEWLTPCDA
jgi:hypothetical protein